MPKTREEIKDYHLKFSKEEDIDLAFKIMNILKGKTLKEANEVLSKTKSIMLDTCVCN